LTLNITVKGRW